MTQQWFGVGEAESLRETRREPVPGGSRAASLRRDGLPETLRLAHVAHPSSAA